MALVTCLLISTNLFAFSFEDLRQGALSFIAKFISKEENNIVKYSLPEIPKNQEKATSTLVYDKNDSIEIKKTPYDSLSPEEKRRYDFSFLEELFVVVRNSKGSDDELSLYLNVLNQGGSREGVYRKVTLDEIYQSLENFEETISDKAIKFTLRFSKKYLDKNFKKDSFKNINIYSLKRITIENVLDVIESLKKNEDSVYQYYAILSSELARDYPEFFTNKIRRNSDEAFHYDWAKGVPFQHLKSEVIIKLNTVLNLLQGN